MTKYRQTDATLGGAGRMRIKQRLKDVVQTFWFSYGTRVGNHDLTFLVGKIKTTLVKADPEEINSVSNLISQKY